jgi:hypothetical protein
MKSGYSSEESHFFYVYLSAAKVSDSCQNDSFAAIARIFSPDKRFGRAQLMLE